MSVPVDYFSQTSSSTLIHHSGKWHTTLPKLMVLLVLLHRSQPSVGSVLRNNYNTVAVFQILACFSLFSYLFLACTISISCTYCLIFIFSLSQALLKFDRRTELLRILLQLMISLNGPRSHYCRPMTSI
ncbi:hypothetical protein PAXRUDRAFT_237056 [Paxillus rubicundulus Ve08.2h10]|uniref:Uncharacterized protein n=1 Tax=Paxillus rubicundulus Ve08.2h10 TaxID=930991 RepID=A0A0D0E686_9AGAM|nr:hypothetical protein PAXRUDRAFT_237056 [Paxillus rubicundulus Ve08.2h10]